MHYWFYNAVPRATSMPAVLKLELRLYVPFSCLFMPSRALGVLVRPLPAASRSSYPFVLDDGVARCSGQHLRAGPYQFLSRPS